MPSDLIPNFQNERAFFKAELKNEKKSDMI